MPNFDSNGSFGIVAPAGTPPDVIAKLNMAFVTVLNDPDIVRRIRELGAEPLPMMPSEFGVFVEAEAQKMAQDHGSERQTKLTDGLRASSIETHRQAKFQSKRRWNATRAASAGGRQYRPLLALLIRRGKSQTCLTIGAHCVRSRARYSRYSAAVSDAGSMPMSAREAIISLCATDSPTSS